MAKWIEEIGDDHPDQPRFDGGVFGAVIGIFLFWIVVGVIASIVLHLTGVVS